MRWIAYQFLKINKRVGEKRKQTTEEMKIKESLFSSTLVSITK
jgi:hypothetical protein